jgi:hypothetical protein
MKDFEEFLVDFWSAKFTYIILEAVIFAYIRKIIFRQENFSITLMEIKNEPKIEENIQKPGFFSSFYQKTKEMTIKSKTLELQDILVKFVFTKCILFIPIDAAVFAPSCNASLFKSIQTILLGLKSFNNIETAQ